jgi:hypothetical protein
MDGLASGSETKVSVGIQSSPWAQKVRKGILIVRTSVGNARMTGIY